MKIWNLRNCILLVLPILIASVLSAGEPKPENPKPGENARPVTPAVSPNPVLPERNDTPTLPSREPEPSATGGSDLRALIGVNPVGLKRTEVPRLPAMTLRGFIQPQGHPASALLEISELNRVFVVQVGTEIPITVAGRINPVGRGELTGLNGAQRPAQPQGNANDGQSQVILKVLKITSEGVTVEAGLLAQTIIIR